MHNKYLLERHKHLRGKYDTLQKKQVLQFSKH